MRVRVRAHDVERCEQASLEQGSVRKQWIHEVTVVAIDAAADAFAVRVDREGQISLPREIVGHRVEIGIRSVPGVTD